MFVLIMNVLHLGRVLSVLMIFGSLLIIRGKGEPCLKGFMAIDSLISNALLLGDVITASGKEQWLFPTININCSARVSGLYFLAEIEGNGGGKRNKYPELQVWRSREENEYTKTYSVSGKPSLLRAQVYEFSGLSWEVQAGDILGMYQPDLKKSKYAFSFQQNGEISTYRLSNRRNAPSTFTITNNDVHSDLHYYPLVAIETNNPHCVSGFIKRGDLISKGEFLSDTSTNNLVEYHNQLRLVPGMRFGCGGTITKYVFAAKRRDVDGQQTYPHLQIWQTTSSNSYVRRSSIALGGYTTTPFINVFEVTPSEPVEFSRGDNLGLYLPPASQNPLILGYQHHSSSDDTGTRSYVYQNPIAGHRASAFISNLRGVNIDYDTPILRVEITVDCGAPESPTNGIVAAPSTVNGSVANYTCNTGYSLVGVGKRVCLESLNGTWSNDLPTCEVVDCGLPPSPHANSQLNIGNTTYGSRATYTCQRGFQPSSSQPLECTSNGEWSGSIPTCRGIQCSVLSALQHGVVQIMANKTDTQLYAQALYTCNTGYTLNGESSRICQENGHWTGIAPICIVDCSQLGRVQGGSVVLLNRSTAIGSVAVYSCNKRMKMIGNTSLICKEDSTWSSNPPVCEPIQCELPSLPMNSRISAIQNETMLDAVVEYSCEDGFILEGNKSRICQQDEQWSGLEPRCIKSIEPTVTMPIETTSSRAQRTTEIFTDTETTSSGDGDLVTLPPEEDGLNPKGPRLTVGDITIIAVIATLVGIIVAMASVILLLYVRRKKQNKMEVDTLECTLQQHTSTSVDNPVYEGDQHLSFSHWNTGTYHHRVKNSNLSTHRNPSNQQQLESNKESTENLHYHVSTIAIPDVSQHYEFADFVGSDRHYDTASNCGASQHEVPVSPYEIPTSCHMYSNIYGSLPWGTYVPTEEQRKSTVDSSTSSLTSPKSLSSEENQRMFFTESEIYWRPATDSAGLYEQLAQNKYREILRKQIQTTEHLGSGHFGNVDQGLWQSPAGVIKVAIKTLKEGANEIDKVKFLQEAAVNGQFRHKNVVKLHGVVTVGEPVMMILELLPQGDLRNYLIRTKPVPGEMLPSEWPELLLKFCQNIASGMEYLSTKAFIHRDLAARNILVAEDKTCKISDFGLSRDLEDETYYISHGGKIPVKWTAPEALHFKKYSTASDVWSFGAVIYEIWSLGHKPFESFSNIETIRLIDRGYRLLPPPGCPRFIYQLMIQCWHPEASARPTFSSLLQELKHTDPTTWYMVEDSGEHTTANMLGAPLEASKDLYLELQQRYSIHN